MEIGIVTKFTNSLNDLVSERGYDIKGFAQDLGVSKYLVYKWREGKDVKLKTLIKLADFFDCSIEYLCGKTDVCLDYTPNKEILPFGVRIKQVLAECHVSAYRLLENTTIKRSQYQHWKDGIEPRLSSLETIAEYLSITIDYLVGRDLMR